MDLRWLRDEKSDAELVQEIREQLDTRSKWRTWVVSLMVAVQLPLLYVLATTFSSVVGPIGKMWGTPVVGVTVAFLLGSGYGLFLATFFNNLADVVGVTNNARRDKLLVKLFDDAELGQTSDVA